MTIDPQILVRVADDPHKWGQAPGPLDFELASLLGKVNSEETFWELGRCVDLRVARMLNAFGRRMASLAMRRKDSGWIRHGLKATQLAAVAEDDREVLPTYALLYRAAELAGANAKQLFTELSVVVGEAETPKQFANRPPDKRTVEAMGFVETQNGDGSVTWQSKT